MVASLVSDLRASVSSVRLEAHRPVGGSDLEMVVNYYWNIELCKSLYPSIHALEVCLRNNIHAAATDRYGTPFWFDVADALLPGQVELVEGARNKLREKNKPQTPDDIVAALMFGFWVSLLNKPYELPLPPAPPNQLTWHDAHSRPTALFAATFPHAPNAFQSRKKISKRCNKFLWLRNRAMHHETIWKYSSLPNTHSEILDLVGWLSPRMRATIALCDEFPIVHAGGKVAIEAKLKNYLGIS